MLITVVNVSTTLLLTAMDAATVTHSGLESTVSHTPEHATTPVLNRQAVAAQLHMTAPYALSTLAGTCMERQLVTQAMVLLTVADTSASVTANV